MGRPTACTPEVTKRICRHLRRGGYRTSAAKAAGISWTAFKEWMQRGAAGEKPFATFAADVKEAEGKAESLLLLRISKASRRPLTWTAAAWLLERRHKGRWARSDHLKVDADVRHKVLNLPEWVELRDLLLAALGPHPDARAAVLGALAARSATGSKTPDEASNATRRLE